MTPTAPAQKQPPAPSVEPKPSYDSEREHYDRNRRRAEPEFQDGSFGFISRNDQDRMDIDLDTRHDNRQRDRRDEGRYRDNGRDNNYRPLYSDGLYSRSRGRGYR